LMKSWIQCLRWILLLQLLLNGLDFFLPVPLLDGKIAKSMEWGSRFEIGEGIYTILSIGFGSVLASINLAIPDRQGLMVPPSWWRPHPLVPP
jgi:hypothetical protein